MRGTYRYEREATSAAKTAEKKNSRKRKRGNVGWKGKGPFRQLVFRFRQERDRSTID